MESALSHLFHAFIIAVILYLFMIFVLGQSQTKAMNRSILIAAIALVYMILFGHGLPTHINKI
jgi:VIT1/CCC1 family predicted Fe2+/Mn2+ transporter